MFYAQKMIDGENYYQILGLPEDALIKEVQNAWRKLAKDNHEDVVPKWERKAAKERMFTINEAYEVLSNEDKRADYDNGHMLNGGSKIELVRRRVRKAKESGSTNSDSPLSLETVNYGIVAGIKVALFQSDDWVRD